MNKLRILHLEDVPTDAELVGRELKRSAINFERLVVDNKQDYLRALTEYAPDIILSDHSLPSFNSTEALKLLKESGLNIPFILITATVSEEFAVNVIKEGAADYILKDRMQRLPAAIHNAIEKANLENERRRAFNELNLLFNTIGEAFFSRDMVEDKLIQISPACEQIFGYKSEEFLNDPELWQNIIHPDDQQIYHDQFVKLHNNEQALFEYRIIHKRLGERWVETKMLPSLNHQDTLMRLYGVTRDIHERKIAEQRVQEQNDRLQEAMETQIQILDALPAKIALVNERGKIRAVNGLWRKEALDNNLGIPNYGVGYSYFALAPHVNEADMEDAQKIAKGIRDVINRTRTEFSFEYQCKTGGPKKWSRVVVAPLTDQNQHEAVVLNMDVTATKLAQESLQQSEANLKSVFENTDVAIVLFDEHFHAISFNNNAAAYAQTYLHKKLRTGKDGLNFFPKERKRGLKKAFEKAMRHEVVTYETSFVHPDGYAAWFEAKWFGVSNARQESIGVILTITDITKAKQAEFERGRMTADLLQRNKDLEQFTYIVSHNLRAPLANIIGLIGILKDPTTPVDDYDEIIRVLALSADNLDKVVLDLNHILQAKTHFNGNIEQISLTQLVDDIKHTISQLITRENVTITCNFNRKDEITTLKIYLYSIFYNLIVNSIKYKCPGIDPVINIESNVRDDCIHITFKDNGRGIDLERYGEHIFGLYKRFDQTVEGKGMGLFMVKMQAENLGGTVKVASAPGEGTEFTVELPITSNAGK